MCYACYRHLSLLCTFVLKPIGILAPELRTQSLSIIRNFAFNSASRPILLASDELMYVLKCVIGSGAPSEQLIVTTIIWRLVANCYKAKHAFRGGSVLESLWLLKDRIATVEMSDEENDETVEQRELLLVIEALRLIFEK